MAAVVCLCVHRLCVLTSWLCCCAVTRPVRQEGRLRRRLQDVPLDATVVTCFHSDSHETVGLQTWARVQCIVCCIYLPEGAYWLAWVAGWSGLWICACRRLCTGLGRLISCRAVTLGYDAPSWAAAAEGCTVLRQANRRSPACTHQAVPWRQALMDASGFGAHTLSQACPEADTCKTPPPHVQ